MSCMAKSHVYSWRVSAETLTTLERVARAEGRTDAAHLDQVVLEDLTRRGALRDTADEASRRARAQKWFGSVTSGPLLDSTGARDRLRARLRKQHGR